MSWTALFCKEGGDIRGAVDVLAIDDLLVRRQDIGIRAYCFPQIDSLSFRFFDQDDHLLLDHASTASGQSIWECSTATAHINLGTVYHSTLNGIVDDSFMQILYVTSEVCQGVLFILGGTGRILCASQGPSFPTLHAQKRGKNEKPSSE